VLEHRVFHIETYGVRALCAPHSMTHNQDYKHSLHVQIYQQSSAPLLQLRAMNPYVVSAIQNVEATADHVMAPRQTQPLSLTSSLEGHHRQCMGVSAFAFQARTLPLGYGLCTI
jgi:hypothetical protein